MDERLMITYLPLWLRRRRTSRFENNGDYFSDILALAGATAMDSFVGAVWVSDGCGFAGCERAESVEVNIQAEGDSNRSAA
ncbi:MAG TPA: hypothetical protein VMF50_07330 [Candidatus Binataceae bacterium]|nr:hypothetical protein [Candidatus Binataceae bacterium]